jgi:hypothetical protein
MDPRFTEGEWLGDSYLPLRVIEKYASVRKMRLVAAAYVRSLRDPDIVDDAVRCGDLIEAVADDQTLPWTGPVNWRATRVLYTEEPEEVAKGLRMVVAESELAPPWFHAPLIIDIIGNPFRPVVLDPTWLTSTVVALAAGIYGEKAFDRMQILADALQDAGCEDSDVLEHCRDGLPHVRGCWVVDLLLGKE